MTRMRIALTLVALLIFSVPAHADAAFQHWLQGTWPEAQKLGISRATFDKAISGLEPDYSLPDLAIPGKPEKPPPGQPEFVQTPGRYLREPLFKRSGRARQRIGRAAPRHAGAHREGVRRTRQCGAGDLGARDRLRPRGRGPRRFAGLGDARLCRQAQGLLPQRVPLRLEDAAGRRAAGAPALLLGRRHGHDAVPAVGVLQIWRRFRPRRQSRHLAFGAGRACFRRQAAQGQRLADG